MMSYFGGCHNLVKLDIFFFSFFIVFLIRTSIAEGDSNDPFYESLSKEAMVQLAGYGEDKLSTILVTGTVLCEACSLQGEPEVLAWPISGALVTVSCQRSGKWSKTCSAQAVTDEYGDFVIDLPSHLHAIPNLERSCSVKVLRMPKNSVCRPSHVRKEKSLVLSSAGDGIRKYTAGKINFLDSTSKPLHKCTNRSSHRREVW